MAPEFSQAALKAVANVVTGGPGNATVYPFGLYRSGYQLERFFRGLGYDVRLGGHSRVPCTIERLTEINSMPDGFERIADSRLDTARPSFGPPDGNAALLDVFGWVGLQLLHLSS